MILRGVIHHYWKRRRYQKYSKHFEKNFLGRLLKIALILTALLFIHSMAMVYLEKMSFADALWLSVTTATTVGYGDYSATSWQGRLVTVVCLYALGIALLAQLAAEFFDYRILLRERKIQGLWRWDDMKNHILIINTPNENTEFYLLQLTEQIRATPQLEEMPIQILTRKYSEGLPVSLSGVGVVHYNGVAENSVFSFGVLMINM